jgi:hypothetical protein
MLCNNLQHIINHCGVIGYEIQKASDRTYVQYLCTEKVGAKKSERGFFT